MCGIVGYIGQKQASSVLMEGLKRIEYRGYDSAGLALFQSQDHKGRLICVKAAGQIAQLQRLLEGRNLSSTLGIAHTRWATHGAPNQNNAHPHLDTEGKLAVVHNGIIENYRTLKVYLEGEGIVFASDTDTEVLAHLFARYYKGDLAEAVRQGLSLIEGTYGIAVIHADEPDTLVVARRGSPLIVGIGENEYIVASDAAAIIEHTGEVLYLEDDEIAVARRSDFQTLKTDAIPLNERLQKIEWSLDQIEKKGYPHFMLKEIFEQPESLTNTMRGRFNASKGEVRLGGLRDYIEELTRLRRVILVGCGTAWHAALIGEYMLEDIARLPAEVEYASEFRYRNPVVEEGSVVVAVSQSGETADTLEAMREAKSKGALSIGIVNVVGSTIARDTKAGVYLHAGPEIGVASTKAFTSQLVVLYMFALFLAQRRHPEPPQAAEMIKALERIPDQVRTALALNEQIKEVARIYKDRPDWLYLGRGYNFPVALEGALKMKEISYAHAEGLPAAEMKHGPIALITPGMPVVFLANKGPQYKKILGNIEEVNARGGNVLCVATEGDREIQRLARHTFSVPDVREPLQPIVNVAVLQLLAYHVATMKGCSVDKPRSLAKSVTVE